MAAKQVLYDQHARARMASGLDALANAVKVTLGPRGRNVLIEKLGGRKEVAQVGTIAASGDSVVGELLAEAMEKVGPQGVVTLEQAKSIETTVDLGRLEKITVEAGQTTLISGAGKKPDIDRRVEQLKAQIELAASDADRAGVLDPAKVVRVAVQKAASVASLMLTTEVLIAESSPEAKGRRTPAAGVVS